MSEGVSEFALIQRFFSGLGPSNTDLRLGLGDDCAVVDVPAGTSLCLSIDTMVEGVHFLASTPAKYVASRALGAAVSDLAAMGATPSHFTLALSLPSINLVWLQAFSSGLSAAADKFKISLVGGDTTQGPLAISMQVHGCVPKGAELRRSGAQSGDLLVVSGSLGDAAGALAFLDKHEPSEQQSLLLDRYHSPQPRIELGSFLCQRASACIDISDGLLADAEHLANASSCKLNIDAEALPLSAALLACSKEGAETLALTGGDDYELLFTVSPEKFSLWMLDSSFPALTVIGSVSEGEGVEVSRQGKVFETNYKGYLHFE